MSNAPGLDMLEASLSQQVSNAATVSIRPDEISFRTLLMLTMTRSAGI